MLQKVFNLKTFGKQERAMMPVNAVRGRDLPALTGAVRS